MASTPPPPDGDAAPVSPRRRLLRERRLWIVGGGVALCAVAIAAWLLLRSPGDPASPAGRKGFDPNARPLPVVTAPVTKGRLDVYLAALGTVIPRNVVTVRSRVDGQLIRVAFREGQMVRAGDLLAEIDPRPFEVQLTQAKGQMAKDQALLKNAEVDLERYRTLLSQDSISKQQVDTQEALVRQYRGAIESDQGQIDNAKLQLTYARVIAPISGRVGLRQIDPGNIVRASDANGLVVITQLQPITVLFTLPEDNVPRVMKRLQSGDPPPVEAYDRDQKTKLATGTVLTIDNQIDTATGTVKLKAEFANQDAALFPNQFVNARMLVDTLPDATLVPTAAIQRGSPGTFVYVAKDDRSVTVRPIKLGPAQGDNTSVESGLVPGEQVVVDGADKLREGAKVEPITREAQGAPAPGGARRGQRPEGQPRGEGPRRRDSSQ